MALETKVVHPQLLLVAKRFCFPTFLDLVIDFVRAKYGLSSNKFKSAISSYNLLEKKDLQNQIEKIVETFVSPKK